MKQLNLGLGIRLFYLNGIETPKVRKRKFVAKINFLFKILAHKSQV